MKSTSSDIATGYFSDKTKSRAVAVIATLSVFWAFMLASQQVTTSTNKSLHLAIITLTMAFSSPWHPSNGAWLAVNVRLVFLVRYTLMILVTGSHTRRKINYHGNVDYVCQLLRHRRSSAPPCDDKPL